MGKFLLVAACVLTAMGAFAGEAAQEPAKHFVATYGDIEVIALLDATGTGKVDLLIGATEDDLERAKEPGALDTTINAFVVRMNGKTYLFDAGLPNGDLLAALDEAGIAPDDIDAIFLTHFHFDHIGGLLKDGKAVFTSPDLHVPKVEVDKWNDRGIDFLTVYAARSNAFDWDKEIVPGVTGLDAAGHTPGHTVYLLESGDDKVMIIGDLIHLPGVQLANLDIAMTYDTDPDQAVIARRRIFDRLAKEGMPLASMHIPFPGLGTLRAEGDSYAFDKEK